VRSSFDGDDRMVVFFLASKNQKMTVKYVDPFSPGLTFNWTRVIFLGKRGGLLHIISKELLLSTALCAAGVTIIYVATTNGPERDVSDIVLGFEDAVSYVATRFQAALSLMLGFYSTTLYNRWWTVREKEAVVMGRIHDISVQISGLIRDENDSEKAAEVRSNLLRWVNLSHAIAIGEVYEKQPNCFGTLERLRGMGLATNAEHNLLSEQPRSHYLAPFVWFTNLVGELKGKGLYGIDIATTQVLADNITQIRGNLAYLYLYRDIQVPLIYREQVNFTVRFYMLIVFFSSIAREVAAEDNDTSELSKRAFWVILSFSFEYFLFVGWLSLADALGNPYRHWDDEYEWEEYVKTVARNSFLMGKLFRSGCTSLEGTTASAEEVDKKLVATIVGWG